MRQRGEARGGGALSIPAEGWKGILDAALAHGGAKRGTSASECERGGLMRSETLHKDKDEMLRLLAAGVK